MNWATSPTVLGNHAVFDEDDRYSRQRVLAEIGAEGQQRLADASVLLVGCGALGSVQSELLVRAGIGAIRIVDRDVVEEHNLQRQVLFDEGDAAAGLPKAEAAVRKLRRINSAARIEGLVTDMTSHNIERLMADADVVVDGTDNFETRYLINDACVKHGKPWIYGGVVSTTGMTLTVVPGKGPCLRCLFPDPPPVGSLPTCETAGILNTLPTVIASLQATEAIKLIVGDEPEQCRLFTMNLWDRSFHAMAIAKNRDCPCCGKAQFDFLEAESVSWTRALCGRNAVQISPPQPTQLYLEDLSKRLRHVGKVTRTGLLLQLDINDYRLLVFPDGRAIVKGTADETVARTLYAKYLGS